MQAADSLVFASYNIHKGVGADRRCDPERILMVLHEVGADVIALQEADNRFGTREAVIPPTLLAHGSPWRAVAPGVIDRARRAGSLGWHGNVILVRRDLVVTGCHAVPLPTLEPRGAVAVDLEWAGQGVRVIGMHLDLSGLRRRQQVRVACAAAGRGPRVLMGDFNEWAPRGGALQAFPGDLSVLAPGRSFPARRPLGQLDRIVASHDWVVDGIGVHHSPLAQQASDHLPVWARLRLSGKAPA
ncbi:MULTISPECIES: endonuclease/exonuclease/phosphatase family protein [unclassified Novosphingobium]|uniref:endonuclease/exonuclease/phosphatase family protein n=2 Tax=Novosphingobium TaxID=165696 RepID=UPI000D2F88D0|nr:MULTISPECIES: endonuclease/exonuclease/phosphatase family protein [unclassified Novosphingobium]PTR11479.1 endonuclease/exonuclease/phosphatase family metal-dependent hydrolase [Novosphingobium sp. GV055]PUB04260.1 endonuclease/exonuclease/phosphatase family metal-dependent hydrolase [Novosphingobium sp. GV061]PUB20651.1 endonuclease/exonuclease/phosphatase family metal-dependent hydrolase [Novosphingobium sp. GV079]PUB42377.1 endonuclease/exonuclease/phosphatase family metal-dependent hydro